MAFRFAALIWSVLALGLNAYLAFAAAVQSSALAPILWGSAVALIVSAGLVLLWHRPWTAVVAVLVSAIGIVVVGGGMFVGPSTGESSGLRLFSLAAFAVSLVSAWIVASGRRPNDSR